MYRKVVVPLDGSDLAECSLSEVKNILGPGSDVLFIQVIQPLSMRATVEVPQEILREAERKNVAAARKYMEKIAAELKGTGVNVKTEIVWGNPADEIIQYAQKNKADLIVITTHGRSGVSRWAFGSVADKVLRTAAMPVLMVTPSGCRVA
jgi:nucleotide-binding universal stress UspA family protein